VIKFPRAFATSNPAGFDGLFDWDFLDDIWPRNIRPCDIDASVDDRGKRILMFETKAPGAVLSDARQQHLAAYIEIGQGKIITFVLYGKNAAAICKMEIWWWSPNRQEVMKKVVDPATSDMVRSYCLRWVNLSS
jgi:hypothetical protein